MLMFEFIKVFGNVLDSNIISKFFHFGFRQMFVSHVDAEVYLAVYDDVHAVFELSKLVQHITLRTELICQ